MAKKQALKPWLQQKLDFDAPIALPQPVRQTWIEAGYQLYGGIDPGGGCGLAVVGYNLASNLAAVVGLGTYTHTDLLAMLRHNLGGLRSIGMEEYLNYTVSPGASAGSNNPTSQTIGAVVDLCTNHGTPCQMQPASIKNPVWEWMHNRWPDLDMSYNSQHERDALCHAFWQVRQVIYNRPTKGKGKK